MTQPYIPDLDENEDTLFRYKSAFLLYLQKKVEDCGVILNDLFPLNPNHTVHMSQASCSLDSATLSIAERLIDEAPSADPRWGTSFRNGKHRAYLSLYLYLWLSDKLFVVCWKLGIIN